MRNSCTLTTYSAADEHRKEAAARSAGDQRNGNQHHASQLVLKTFRLADIVRAALLPLAPSIRAEFVYACVAKARDTATSDIDLIKAFVTRVMKQPKLWLIGDEHGLAA